MEVLGDCIDLIQLLDMLPCQEPIVGLAKNCRTLGKEAAAGRPRHAMHWLHAFLPKVHHTSLHGGRARCLLGVHGCALLTLSMCQVDYAWDEPMAAHRLRVMLDTDGTFRDVGAHEYNLDVIRVRLGCARLSDMWVSCMQSCLPAEHC